MNFRTILVHLDRSGRSAARAALAAQWAKAHESHLVGLVPTGLHGGVVPAGTVAVGMTDYIADAASRLRLRAEAVAREFREGIHESGPLSYEVCLADGGAVDALVRHGRASDLLVLGQDGDGSDAADATARGLVPQVLVEAGRPLLIVPCAGNFNASAKNVAVAWDGSRESAIAIHAGLPALRRAARVTLISCSHPGGADDERRLLVPEMLQFLLRHGVRASAQREVTEIDIADALLSRTAELGADLLVMGGYGHSRLRERVLGGVTRRILARMAVPVLMVH
ncbi:universal stress protein [Variovorax paradoxus]|jgi:nucleotide-binding universal stress UspA family protein|uniref:universal stress protein n=1 Tax=Variovorax TaxID=34072 RepID=UPI00036E9BED|nr:universal stress protein [Variovorax paradoxus]MBW8892234.1 universal stress protein [Burkholderiales bacterium]